MKKISYILLPLRLLELELVLVPRLLDPVLRPLVPDDVVVLPLRLLVLLLLRVEVLVPVSLVLVLELRLVLVPRLLLLSELTPLRLLVLVLRLLPLSELTLLRLLLLEPRLLLLSELTPLRLLVLELRLLLLSELTPLRLELLVPLLVLSFISPVRLGAGVVLRLPVTRSVVVMVLSLRLLVMRLPLRCVGSFCTFTCEREAVILPTSGSPV